MAKELINKYLLKTRQESKDLVEWKKTILSFLDKNLTLKSPLNIELATFTVLEVMKMDETLEVEKIEKGAQD